MRSGKRFGREETRRAVLMVVGFVGVGASAEVDAVVEVVLVEDWECVGVKLPGLAAEFCWCGNAALFAYVERGELVDVADSALIGIDDGMALGDGSIDVAVARRLSMDCRADGKRDVGRVPLMSLSCDPCLLYAL